MASSHGESLNHSVEPVIEQYYRAIHAKNAAAIADVFEPDGAFLYPESPPLRGRDEIRKAEERILAPIDTITITPDQIFVVGHRAAVKFTMQVKAKNGQSALLDGIDTFQIAPDGKIRQATVYYDARALAALIQPASRASG